MLSELNVIPHAPANTLGETPAYCDWLEKLFWVDILEKMFFSYCLQSGAIQGYSLTVTISACLPTSQRGTMLLVSDKGLFLYDLKVRRIQSKIAEFPESGTRPNEAQIDNNGHLIMGTMGWSAQRGAGAWYRFSRQEGIFHQLQDQVTIPNTLLFDNEQIIYGDTPQSRLYQVDTQANSWAEKSTELGEIDGGGLDGSCFTRQGYVIGARWGMSKLSVFDSKADLALLEDCPLMVTNPTSCLVVGKQLFITSACYGLNKPKAQEGKLIQGRTWLSGMPVNRFAL